MWECCLVPDSQRQQQICYRKKKQRRKEGWGSNGFGGEGTHTQQRLLQCKMVETNLRGESEKAGQISYVPAGLCVGLPLKWNLRVAFFKEQCFIIQLELPHPPPPQAAKLISTKIQPSQHITSAKRRSDKDTELQCFQVGKIPQSSSGFLYSIIKAVIFLPWNWLRRRRIPKDHRSKTGPAACLAGAPVRSSSMGGVTPLAPASSCLPASLALWQMIPMTAGRNNLQLNIPLWSVNVRGGASLSGKHRDTHTPLHTPSY